MWLVVTVFSMRTQNIFIITGSSTGQHWFKEFVIWLICIVFCGHKIMTGSYALDRSLGRLPLAEWWFSCGWQWCEIPEHTLIYNTLTPQAEFSRLSATQKISWRSHRKPSTFPPCFLCLSQSVKKNYHYIFMWSTWILYQPTKIRSL